MPLPTTRASSSRGRKESRFGAIRRKADVAARVDRQDVLDADKDRRLNYWWFEDGRRLGLEAYLPADQGVVVAAALDRVAKSMPDVQDASALEPEDLEGSLEVRRADALHALCSSRLAQDQDQDRATVVVHAELTALLGEDSACELDEGPVIHPETARRLACDSRVELVLHGADGDALGIGRASRVIPAWLMRQLRHRDRGCVFPGCGRRFLLHAHHILHWIRGGPTELGNLALVCSFHHKLLHEYGWTMKLGPPGLAEWFGPDGSLFRWRDALELSQG